VDFAESVEVATEVVDSLASFVGQFNDIGCRVVLVEIHGVSAFATWDAEHDSCRVAINTGINAMTTGDLLAVHSDAAWLYDSTGADWGGTTLEKIAIGADYDNGDGLHLNHLGDYYKGDSVWVNTLGAINFASQRAFYVDVATGHDWTNVGTQGSPFQTLQAGMMHAGAGDHVYLTAGEYDRNTSTGQDGYLSIAFKFVRTGTAANPVRIYGNGSTLTNTLLGETRNGATSSYRPDSTHVIFNGFTFTDYTYGLDVDDMRGLVLDECTFIGSGISLDGTSYVVVDDCYLGRTSGHVINGLIDVVDCDSLIVVDTELYNSSATSNKSVYLGAAVDATDVFRFIGIDYTADRVAAPLLTVAAANAHTVELKNSVVDTYNTFAMVCNVSQTLVADNNFFNGNGFFIAAPKSLAQWRTATGGDEQWDYIGVVDSDTMKYGGIAHPNYYAYTQRQHSSDWCSIGLTQYAAPTYPDDFDELIHLDSLLIYLPWVWTGADTTGNFKIHTDKSLFEYIDYQFDSGQLYIGRDPHILPDGFK
jgi:hypothetical protein